MEATRYARQSGSAALPAKRSRAQIAEALRVKGQAASADISAALILFEAVTSRRFRRMPLLQIIAEERLEGCWGWNGSDQGDFMAPNLIRLSESSSKSTAVHEAAHFARHSARLDRDSAMPKFAYRAVDEMCSMFVEGFASEGGAGLDPLPYALNLYGLWRNGHAVDRPTILCDYIFFLQVRELVSVGTRAGAQEFLDGALKAAEAVVDTGILVRREAFYSLGKALAVMQLVNNGLSVAKTVRDMMDIGPVGLLRNAVGQKARRQADGFLDLLESRLYRACSGRNGEAGDGGMDEERYGRSVTYMRNSLAQTYRYIFREHHPAGNLLGNGPLCHSIMPRS